MASFNTLSSSVVAVNPSRSRSTSSQYSMPNLSPIVGQASDALSSPSLRLRSSCASSRFSNGATRHPSFGGLNSSNLWISATMKPEPLKIMISGAPASGKGTQCELIKKKYGLVHIAAGDLLRTEIAAGTLKGKLAKDYMENGMLVPDDIVVVMVKERLLQPDAQENGWLLDGYPRSLSQAKALEDLGIRPDLFILLDVNENALVKRVIGRRLDPVTGKTYHLEYSPPENEEIAARLVQRFDDTEEKVKLRLKTHHQNVESVLALYKDITVKHLKKHSIGSKCREYSLHELMIESQNISWDCVAWGIMYEASRFFKICAWDEINERSLGICEQSSLFFVPFFACARGS